MTYRRFLKIPSSASLRGAGKRVAKKDSMTRDGASPGQRSSPYRDLIALCSTFFRRGTVAAHDSKKRKGGAADFGSGRYRGWIGLSKNGQQINGWLVDSRNLNDRLQVIVRADDIRIGPVLADKPRPALIEKGFGDGRYGFTVPLPESKRAGGVTVLSVHPIDDPRQVVAAGAPGKSVTELKSLLGPLPADDDELGAPLDAGREAFVSLEQMSFGDFMKPYLEEVGALLDRNEWGQLATLGEDLLAGRELRRLLFAAGRALFFEKKFAQAARLFAALRGIAPENEEARFHHSVCLARLGENRSAAEQLRQLFAAEWQPLRVARELANVLVDLMRAAGHESSNELQPELIAVVNKLVAIKPDVTLRPMVLNAIGHAGQQALAIRLFDNAIAQNPDSAQPYVHKSRFLLSVSRIEEALKLSEKVLERWPDNLQARFDLQVFGKLRGMKAVKESTIVATVVDRPNGLSVSTSGRSPGPKGTAATTEDMLKRLRALDADWALFVADESDEHVNDAQIRGLVGRAAVAGCIRLSPAAVMWRTQTLEGLWESGLLGDRHGIVGALGDVESQYRYGEPVRANEGVALLISRHGSIKFGGVEQFMVSAAEFYRSLGYEPILVGTRPDMVGQSGKVGEIEFDFIADSPATLRKYILKKKATLLHTFPGLGYQVAQALQYHSARFVYGIHFWRDSLGSMTSDVFFDDDGQPIPRPEFSYVLARASTTYVNSKFTQAIIEAAHGVRCPVVYSVPAD